MRVKIAQFCSVASDAVIQSMDCQSIYDVPLMLHSQHLDEIVMRLTGQTVKGEPDLTRWRSFLDRLHNASREVKIGLVGKYVELQDAYKSISEALVHAATYNDLKLNLTYIHSEQLDDNNAEQLLSGMDGVIIAPDSDSAASKANSQRSNGLVSTTYPRSEYASVCSVWSSNTPATEVRMLR